MGRDDSAPMTIFKSNTTDFDEKSYNISETNRWFRMGGMDNTGLPVAKKVATSVFYGWCVEGVLAGQYGK